VGEEIKVSLVEVGRSDAGFVHEECSVWQQRCNTRQEYQGLGGRLAMFQVSYRNIAVAAIVFIAAGLIAIHFIPGDKQKQKPRPLAAKEKTQNECGVRAYAKYLQDSFALSGLDKSKPLTAQTGEQLLAALTAEKILAKRRLEEQYCLEIVHCNAGIQTATSEALSLSSCLKDEALEEYDAVPREDVPEKDDD
jgi:hypothetical protein